MHFRDLVALVFANLRRMRLRLVLTSLGVVIGTSAIVLMVSLGIGLQNNMQSQLGNLGDATTITVYARVTPSGEYRGIDNEQLNAMDEVEHVAAVMPVLYAGGNGMRYRRFIAFPQILGVTIEGLEAFGYEIAEGRMPRADDEVVIGATVAKSFSKETNDGMGERAPELDLLGKRLDLAYTVYPDEAIAKTDAADATAEAVEKELKLTVVGVLAPGGQDDGAVYLPMESALKVVGIPERKITFDTVLVKADDVSSVADVEEGLRALEVDTISAQQMQRSLNTTFAIIQVVLGAMGAIAMLVAAIGIANTMTMSIYERTREIGIMKAVGASNRQIKRVFLGEAAVIGVLGGLGGLAFSAIGASLANLGVQYYFASNPTFASAAADQTAFFSIPAWLALFAIVFAASVGLLSGVLPAVRAAHLDPLIALRHE